MVFRLSMSPMRGISSQMFNEFFFSISGSAAVGVTPLESADPGGQGGVWGLLRCEYQESAIFEGIRGEGAEGALEFPSVTAGAPISVGRRKWKIYVFFK